MSRKEGGDKGPYRGPPPRWKKVFAERLKSLMTAKKLKTQEAFAKAVTVPRTSLASWLNKKHQAKAYDLFLVGEETKVSIDWVLFGTDAAGNTTNVPQYRGEGPAGDLESQLAEYVLRKLGERGVPVPNRDPMLNVSMLLEAAIDLVANDLKELSRYFESGDLAAGIAADLMHARETLAQNPRPWARKLPLVSLEIRSAHRDAVTLAESAAPETRFVSCGRNWSVFLEDHQLMKPGRMAVHEFEYEVAQPETHFPLTPTLSDAKERARSRTLPAGSRPLEGPLPRKLKARAPRKS
jgi:transcriptional regulator with XRE-family HTH domain